MIEKTGQVQGLNSAGALEDARKQARRKSLMHPLNAIATDFRDRVRQGLRDKGHCLQPAHSSVIVHLKMQGSRLTELADRAGMTKQAMGKMIDELESIGYLEKAADPGDGRAKMIRFTDKGLGLLKDSSVIVDGIWQAYTDMIGEQRLQNIRDELVELNHQILSHKSDRGSEAHNTEQ